MAGIAFVFIVRLKMSVNTSRAVGPRFFRWAYDMLSGPLAFEDPAFLMAILTIFGVN